MSPKNLNKFKELVALDPEFRKEISLVFVKDIKTYFSQIDTAVASKNYEVLFSILEKMKPALETFVLTETLQTITALEELLSDKAEWPLINKRIKDLKTSLAPSFILIENLISH